MLTRVTICAVLILCSSLLSCTATDSQRTTGHGGGTTFNILSFGAKPGERKESTQALIQAWNAACKFRGKSMVLIPPGVYTLGETIFQGPCKSQITVQVQGTLKAVSDVSAFSSGGWITFTDVNGVIVTGGGTIDGQGQSVWQYNDCRTNPDCVLLPASVYMEKVTNSMIKSVNLINSMGFQLHITKGHTITLHSLNITTPEDSPSTDGMHITKSNTIAISRSIIKTGDDCISIGQGSTNVTINQIICGPGHGISIGSLGKEPKELDVKGLIVKNITLQGTTNGIRVKTYPASDPSKVSGMLFQDIIMDNVKNPIIIDQKHGSKSTKPSLVKISDVVYRNIKGTTPSPVAVSLICSPKVPCENVHLHDINFQFKGKQKPTAICSNVKVGYSGVQNPPPCSSELPHYKHISL